MQPQERPEEIPVVAVMMIDERKDDDVDDEVAQNIENPSGLRMIVKASRLGSEDPYTGPSCERAGVCPGRVYSYKWLASMDAHKMSNVNLVGFRVVPYKPTSCAIPNPRLIRSTDRKDIIGRYHIVPITITVVAVSILVLTSVLYW